MNNKHDHNSKKRQRHVILCGRNDFATRGAQAEMDSMEFLLNELQVKTVGDYRLLVNYNMIERGSGKSLEVDIVAINRLGIFLLEIKNWWGRIEAFDQEWVVRRTERRDNAQQLIDHKARVLHSQLFGKNGSFPELGEVSVIGLVVLTRGLKTFVMKGNGSLERIVDLGPQLLEALSTSRLLHRGKASPWIGDAEIQAIQEKLYTQHKAKEICVRGYRVERDLVQRDRCFTFEALHPYIEDHRVRLKRYELPSLEPALLEIHMRQLRRSAQAFFALAPHPHILNTLDFFSDDIHQDIFYEITDLPTGKGLDELMQDKIQQGESMSFAEQLTFLKPVCLALQHAHTYTNNDGKPAPVYHRNICAETVFQMRDGAVKLGDFDFAKLSDKTISVPGQTTLDKPYTAPELLKNFSQASAQSDIYALGVLWHFMASLPREPAQFHASSIEALELPVAAHALMRRMTATNPQERPESITEVLENLQRYQQDA